jgi:hypothetical protein
MKTDDLIKALAADTGTHKRPISQTIALAIATGCIVSAAFLIGHLGVRTGLVETVMQSWHLVIKIAFTLALAIPAYFIVQRAARPDGEAQSLWPLLAIAPAILLAAVGFEYVTGANDNVSDVIMSPNWSVCVIHIPVLSMAPLAAVLYALKQGAPANPALAGAFGGLFSAALGSVLYATFCDADNPMFVAVWYTVGILAMTALGALLGSRLLRW